MESPRMQLIQKRKHLNNTVKRLSVTVDKKPTVYLDELVLVIFHWEGTLVFFFFSTSQSSISAK